jgi:hypothetical protein
MGNSVFVVKNQNGLYLSKQQEWVDGAEAQGLYRTRHRDEAINTVFEVSSRDIYLRAETVICELDAKGVPVLATVEALTPARAAQLARQDLDIDDEPANPAEPLAEDAETEPAATTGGDDAQASAAPDPVETPADAPAGDHDTPSSEEAPQAL